jgi:hypothetical protein
MPTRTIEEREFIDSLPSRAAGKYCNARTPNSDTGYCRKLAGTGTDHLGKGRCKFHGGSSKGRPIIHGMYSDNLPSTIRKEFDKLVKSPQLIDLSSELALTKALLSHYLKLIEDNLGDKDENWMVQEGKHGSDISGEAKALMKILEQMGKIYSRIVTVESKLSKQLTIRDVYLIINQIKVNMNNTCGFCPVRKNITDKIDKAKIAEIVSTETEENN